MRCRVCVCVLLFDFVEVRDEPLVDILTRAGRSEGGDSEAEEDGGMGRNGDSGGEEAGGGGEGGGRQTRRSLT